MRFLFAWLLVGAVALAADVAGTFTDESDDSMAVIDKAADGRVKVNMVYNDEKVVLEGSMTGDDAFTAAGVVDAEDKTSLRIEGVARGDDIHVRFWVSQNGKERSVGSTVFHRKVHKEAPAPKEAEPPRRVADSPPPSSRPREPDTTIAANEDVTLKRNAKAPGPALAFTLPEGFRAYWLDGESDSGLVVLSQHDGRADQDNIYVGALKLSARAQGAAFDDFFASDDFADVKATLKARTAQRVKSDFWDGAMLEGNASFSAENAPKKLETRSWVMISGDYLVYFTCALTNWGDRTDAEQAKKDQALQKIFRDVLMSVRKTE